LQKISSMEIKDKFLNFFIKNKHLVIKNSSIIPNNDPTLLFINSGMAAIKNYFTGNELPPKSELCNIQSCVRTVDIDATGDKHHLTSFQMLGSWSIGSYFKEKAIELAFDFLVNHLNIPKKKLYVSIFSGDKKIGLPLDQESKDTWIKLGIDENHIIALGKKDNFWGPASETGPCGPCTEVFFDTGVGEQYFSGANFDTKERYIEIWNAGVFIMFSKDANGNFNDLPFKSVDTGAGLERLTMTLNGLESVYETDLLFPIKKFLETQFKEYDEKNIRILTDHLRTITLILSEKQNPSNEGRGYIPRKLIRKCMIISNKKDYNLTRVVEFIIDKYGNINENFLKNKNFIINEFQAEQDKFKEVMKVGIEKLESLSKSGKISGKAAFELTTTFGLPFDIIKDFSLKNSLKLNKIEFNKLFEEHKKISRVFSNSENDLFILKGLSVPKTKFIGYESTKSKSKVLKIFSKDLKELKSAKMGEKVFIVLDSTPIYAKSGGQDSDTGKIFSNNFSAIIEYANKNDGIFAHFCNIENGIIEENSVVDINVNLDKRTKNSRAHSATHLLQSALKEIFGTDLHQHGSKVCEDKLSFDFNFTDKISQTEIFRIENIVNCNILKNIEVNISEMSLNEAIKQGATTIFNEKYDDTVRVVNFYDVSKELCCGTHVKRTGDIGIFTVISFEGIGKGLKRITALTGEKALEYIQNSINKLNIAMKMMGVNSDSFLDKLEKIFKEKTKEKPSKKIDNSKFKFIEGSIPLGYYICDSEFSSDAVINVAEKIKGIAILLNTKRVSLAVSKNIKIDAKNLLCTTLETIGCKGGGNNRIASGGIADICGEKVIDEFIKQIRFLS